MTATCICIELAQFIIIDAMAAPKTEHETLPDAGLRELINAHHPTAYLLLLRSTFVLLRHLPLVSFVEQVSTIKLGAKGHWSLGDWSVLAPVTDLRWFRSTHATGGGGKPSLALLDNLVLERIVQSSATSSVLEWYPRVCQSMSKCANTATSPDLLLGSVEIAPVRE